MPRVALDAWGRNQQTFLILLRAAAAMFTHLHHEPMVSVLEEAPEVRVLCWSGNGWTSAARRRYSILFSLRAK